MSPTSSVGASATRSSVEGPGSPEEKSTTSQAGPSARSSAEGPGRPSAEELERAEDESSITLEGASAEGAVKSELIINKIQFYGYRPNFYKGKFY